jgi:hypothetical protein
MRRTTGRTTSSVGKATSQEAIQALIHAAGKLSTKPRLLAVETPETIHDINIEIMSGVRMAA